MRLPYELKIDAYAHIVPPKYLETIRKVAPQMVDRQIMPTPPLYDLDARFRVMDKYEPLRQVLTLGRIPVEHMTGPEKAAELARLAELDKVVVATGGGAFCNEDNREIIHDSGGVSVFLDLPWAELRRRLARDHSHRPMYDDTNQARQLFEERLQQFLRASVRVELDGTESPEEAAQRVADALQEAPCAT